MTTADLARILRQAGVPDTAYVTGGGLGIGECYGIEHTGTGWSLYYSERGRKSPLETHPDEDSACRALLRHMGPAMGGQGKGQGQGRVSGA